MLLYQIAIFSIIVICAMFFGLRGYVLALIGTSLWTIIEVFTLPLAILQFMTIAGGAWVGMAVLRHQHEAQRMGVTPSPSMGDSARALGALTGYAWLGAKSAIKILVELLAISAGIYYVVSQIAAAPRPQPPSATVQGTDSTSHPKSSAPLLDPIAPRHASSALSRPTTRVDLTHCLTLPSDEAIAHCTESTR